MSKAIEELKLALKEEIQKENALLLENAFDHIAPSLVCLASNEGGSSGLNASYNSKTEALNSTSLYTR